MNEIVLAIFLVIRVIIPFSMLIALGEWMRRREKNYRFRM